MTTPKDIVSFFGGDNNITDVTIDDFNCVKKCFKYPEGYMDVYIYYDNDSLDYPQCDPPYAFVSHYNSYRSARPDIIKAVGAYIQHKSESKRKIHQNKLLQMTKEKLKYHIYKGESNNQHKYTYYVSIPLLDVLRVFGTGKSREKEHRQQVIDLWTNKVEKKGKEEEVEEIKEEIKEEVVGDFRIVFIDIPFASTNLSAKNGYIQIDLEKETYIALKRKCVHQKNKKGKYDIDTGGHLYGINNSVFGSVILRKYIEKKLKTIVEQSVSFGINDQRDVADIRTHLLTYIKSHYYVVQFDTPIWDSKNTITLKSKPNPNVNEFSDDTKGKVTCLKISNKPTEDEKKFAAIDDDNEYNVLYLADTIYEYKNIYIISTEMCAGSLLDVIKELNKLPITMESKELRLDLMGIWSFNILICIWNDYENRKMYNLDLKPGNIMFKNTSKFLKRKWKFRYEQREYIIALIKIVLGDYGNIRAVRLDSNTVSRFNGTGPFRANNRVTLRKYIAQTFGRTIAMIAISKKHWDESKFKSISEETDENKRIKLLKEWLISRTMKSYLPLVYLLSDLLCPVDDDRLAVPDIMDHSFWYEPWKLNELSIAEITMKIYFGYDPSILNDTHKLEEYKESHPLLKRVLNNLESF